MKISIIMPVFNAEKWISETIFSILRQTWQDWELICIDDFSSDQSAEIIKQFQVKDARIRLITNTTKGIIPALQLGLKLSTGECITRMDADDLMPAHRLEKMHNKLLASSNKRTVVTGMVRYFSENSVSEGYVRYENWLNERITRADHYKHIFRECVIASPNWLTWTETLRSDGIFEKLRYPEDYDMVFQWMVNDYVIENIAEVTLNWREHAERTSRNSDIYDQPSFFQLKLGWFLNIHGTNQTIGILGAGTKGKIVAQFLMERNTPFEWYDYRAENYSSPIFGQQILSYEQLDKARLLIAIYPSNLDELNQFLEEKGYTIGLNTWYL